MILGSLKSTARIEAIHPHFKTFFDYVKKNDLLNADLGKIELEGDDLFIINAALEGKMVDDVALEAHRKYIDIQLILSGNEAMGWKSLEDGEEISSPYNEENDLMFYADDADEIINFQPGQFAIFFPEDLHAPGIGDGPSRKLIAKVRV